MSPTRDWSIKQSKLKQKKLAWGCEWGRGLRPAAVLCSSLRHDTKKCKWPEWEFSTISHYHSIHRSGENGQQSFIREFYWSKQPCIFQLGNGWALIASSVSKKLSGWSRSHLEFWNVFDYFEHGLKIKFPGHNKNLQNVFDQGTQPTTSFAHFFGTGIITPIFSFLGSAFMSCSLSFLRDDVSKLFQRQRTD